MKSLKLIYLLSLTFSTISALGQNQEGRKPYMLIGDTKWLVNDSIIFSQKETYQASFDSLGRILAERSLTKDEDGNIVDSNQAYYNLDLERPITISSFSTTISSYTTFDEFGTFLKSIVLFANRKDTMFLDYIDVYESGQLKEKLQLTASGDTVREIYTYQGDTTFIETIDLSKGIKIRDEMGKIIYEKHETFIPNNYSCHEYIYERDSYGNVLKFISKNLGKIESTTLHEYIDNIEQKSIKTYADSPYTVVTNFRKVDSK